MILQLNYKDITPGSVSYTVVTKPKVEFVRETLSTNETKSELPNIDNYLVLSRTCNEFFRNIRENFCFEVISEIEMAMRDHSENSLWFSFRKGFITTLKSHEIMSKMKKVLSGGGGVVNLWSSIQKVSRFTYKNFNIPALKYGQEMEEHAAEKFKEVLLFGKEHKNLSVKHCGLFLDKTTPLLVRVLTL